MILEKETSLFNADKNISEGINNAAKYADNYLVADSTGVMVAKRSNPDDPTETPSSTDDPNVYIGVIYEDNENKPVVQIRDGQVVNAEFGSVVTIGRENSYNLKVQKNRIAFYHNGNPKGFITASGVNSIELRAPSGDTYLLSGSLFLTAEGAMLSAPKEGESGPLYLGNCIEIVPSGISISGKTIELWSSGAIKKNGNSYITTRVKEFDNKTISANDNQIFNNLDVSLTGYTPIGIVGFDLSNASSNPANLTKCNVIACKISGSNAYFQIVNTASSQAKIKIAATVLYLAN